MKQLFIRTFSILLVVLGISSALCAQVFQPRVFLLDIATLTEIKKAARLPDNAYKRALKRLVGEADRALKQEPLSVMEKNQTPPDGDKHDYLSLAPYWWPDPEKADGLPYIRKDGEVNPERDEISDRKNINILISSVSTLGLAYYFTENESYAGHATVMLRQWFLNPETRMNPNLRFAQAVKGRNTGRGAGLIETSGLRFVVDAVGLLEGSKSWTQADQKGMADWFQEYFLWLTTSKNGKDESAAKNNHGTWYDVQAVSIAFFLGKDDVARNILNEATTKRIASEIEPDGRMPLELSRTKALGYSTMNLNGFFSLASLADRVGIDLRHFQTSDGRSIQQAVDWILPFWTGEKAWTYKQIIPFNEKECYPLILQSSLYFGDQKYAEAAAKIREVNPESERAKLIYRAK